MLKDSHFINKIIKITYKRGGQLYAINHLIKKIFQMKLPKIKNTMTSFQLTQLNNELEKQNEMQTKREYELLILNSELAYQNEQKEKRAAELVIANIELAYQNSEKEKRAAELILANIELAYQNKEKEARAAELFLANEELLFQNNEKEKRAAELIIANKKLEFENSEKVKRSSELQLANDELAVQNKERTLKAIELSELNLKLQKAEVQREKLIKEMINRNCDLEQFTFMVSHNLRAPTANIIGIADFLNEDGISETDQKEYLNHLTTSVIQLDNIIRDLNKILQIKRNSGNRNERINLTTLVNEIFLSIGELIDSNQVRIKPDFSEAENIMSVKPYIHSIFFNLIINSIKYKKTNEPPLIHIKSHIVENKIIISFLDNGIGIDLKKHGKYLFGLYKRFHTQVEGKGMGLFMVKTQVELLGGNIKVLSKINEGTEFLIELDYKP